MFSTNGNQYFPEDLKPNLKGFVEENTPINEHNFESAIGSKLEKVYDMQLSYTALFNFSNYFIRGNKNRFGIWNYETTIVPPSFIKHYKSVDKVLPSSNFSKQIFIDNGLPAENQVVIPLGIYPERFSNIGKYPLKTKKKYKIFVNIAQPHLRKNIPGVLKAYGKAFTGKDDVCLVLKIAKKSPQLTSDQVPFDEIYKDFRREYKKCGEIEIIDKFIEDIESLYNACDVVFSMSHTEGFWMPGIEGFGANKIVVAPRYGGQLDFMNDNNSILIDGKTIRADDRMQYWEPSPYAKVFNPDINKAAEALKNVIHNYEDYHKQFSSNIRETAEEYTWEKIAKRILNLAI